MFCDRLVEEQDVQKVLKILNSVIEKNFSKEMSEKVLLNPLLISNFMKAEPIEPENEDKGLFEEIDCYSKIK